MPDHNFTVHMNGDTKDTLRSSFLGVLNAVTEMENAFQTCAPNMRNYYPLQNSESAFDKDWSGWISQTKKMEEIRAWAITGYLHAVGEKG